MLSKDTVLEKTKEILADSLDLEEDEIHLESLLFTEFNIESTETLEITFRIEQEFDFVMAESEFWNIPGLIANEGLFDGQFSDEAKKLVDEYFDIPEEKLNSVESPFDLYNLISVNDLVNYIMKKI